MSHHDFPHYTLPYTDRVAKLAQSAIKAGLITRAQFEDHAPPRILNKRLASFVARERTDSDPPDIGRLVSKAAEILLEGQDLNELLWWPNERTYPGQNNTTLVYTIQSDGSERLTDVRHKLSKSNCHSC